MKVLYNKNKSPRFVRIDGTQFERDVEKPVSDEFAAKLLNKKNGYVKSYGFINAQLAADIKAAAAKAEEKIREEYADKVKEAEEKARKESIKRQQKAVADAKKENMERYIVAVKKDIDEAITKEDLWELCTVHGIVINTPENTGMQKLKEKILKAIEE